ncbi:hypothetical protein SDC9_65486 [bioreactor metagenome]|uniref:Uncharacterized protein n=1 Tax=bioreactor metagenome TaxID=1076179 RepID=A0A644XTH8_9ZZZZ
MGQCLILQRRKLVDGKDILTNQYFGEIIKNRKTQKTLSFSIQLLKITDILLGKTMKIRTDFFFAC